MFCPKLVGVLSQVRLRNAIISLEVLPQNLFINPDGSEVEENNHHEKIGSHSQIQGEEQTICLDTDVTSIF